MKKIYIGVLLSLITVLMAGMVYGAISCAVSVPFDYFDENNPRELGINVTWSDAENTSINQGNITISGCISLVQNNDTGSNSTDFDFGFSETDMASALDDVACTVTGIITNVSSNGSVEVNNSIICTSGTFQVDNSVPSFSSASPTDLSKDTDGIITFSYTCSNSSSAVLYVEGAGGYTAYTMTESSDICTYSNLELVTNGFHSWYIEARDGENTSTSQTIQVEVRKPGGVLYAVQEQPITGDVTTGATTGGNAITNIVNTIFETIFGIFDKIFSVFKGG